MAKFKVTRKKVDYIAGNLRHCYYERTIKADSLEDAKRENEKEYERNGYDNFLLFIDEREAEGWGDDGPFEYEEIKEH